MTPELLARLRDAMLADPTIWIQAKNMVLARSKDRQIDFILGELDSEGVRERMEGYGLFEEEEVSQ